MALVLEADGSEASRRSLVVSQAGNPFGFEGFLILYKKLLNEYNLISCINLYVGPNMQW